MNTISFLLALLVLIVSVVAAFVVNRLDPFTGVLVAALSLAILLLTWTPVVAARRV